VNVEASTEAPLATDADTVAIGIFEGEAASRASDLPALNELLSSGEASASFRRVAVAHADGRRFILVGLGKRSRFDGERARAAAATAHRRARDLSAKAMCWEVPDGAGDGVISGLVEGTLLHAYRFDRYVPSNDDGRQVDRLILSDAQRDISAQVREATVVANAQNRARDLGNTPGNDLPPAALAEYASRLAQERGFTSEVLDGAAIRERGMGAFAAVAQGSQQDPRLIRLDYDGVSDSDAPRLAMVGKAVTFDSGGLSLKPARAMHEMKFDMCGGAAVIEAIGALAELRAPVRVIGVVGATENLPSGNAVKPGDIVRALDGTTIEINNTDAEGRLVLADCLTYVVREGASRIIDLATLTGGIVTALGHTYAGLMSNDDAWARAVEEAAGRTGELVWRLPLHEDYAEMVKGRFAQLTNLTARTGASSITAAELLHHFVGDTPWAHLDIAGTAYDVRRPYLDRAATGYGVRLLVDLARSFGDGGDRRVDVGVGLA
jgi:leucyl aminopeptidase